MGNIRKKVFNWRDEVKAGDILRTPSGTYRAVMQVEAWGRYNHWYFFYKRKCSKYKWCFIIKDRNGIKKWGQTGLKLNHFKKKQQFMFKNCTKLTCCDVKHWL